MRLGSQFSENRKTRFSVPLRKIVITDEIQDENRIENWNKIVITDGIQDENRPENWNKMVITDEIQDENRTENWNSSHSILENCLTLV